MVEEHPVEDRAFLMARTIDSRHIGNADSKSVPGAAEGRSGGRAQAPSTNGYVPRRPALKA
jgi:hypothetical protein